MARKATGSKEWRSRLKTWVGRVRGDDGKRSVWVDLCTNDETIAAKRLEQWLLTGEAPSQSGKETFAKAAERILREQKDKDATPDRRHRIRAYALPVIGHIEIAELKPPQVHSVLINMDRQRTVITERAAKVGAALVAHELGVLEATVDKWVRARERTLIAERAAKEGVALVARELGLVEATVDKWVRALPAGHLKSFSVDTVHHMRVDISRILGALVLEGSIATNVAEGVELPEDAEYDDRRFVVLHDEEVGRFFRRGFDSELMMACLMSREFAAQRTSDLLGADYEDYDLVNWTALVRRPKTDSQGTTKFRKRRKRRVTLMYERVRLVIPLPVRAPLLAWREQHRDPITGELPTKGPIFPAQRGKNVGKRKSSRGNSWAEGLRDALWEEGIVRPLPGYETAVGEDRRKYCALQVDTEHTRRAVFHSFRRASVTALRKAGVPVHVAMLITGHQSLPTHMGYNDTDDALEIPEGSLATRPSSSTAVEKSDTHAAEAKGTAMPADAAMQTTTAAEAKAGPAPSAADGYTNARLGQEPARSTPGADLPGARLVAASRSDIDAVAPTSVAELLAQLVGMLRGGALLGSIDPSRGSMLDFSDLSERAKAEEYHQRAQKDSNLRPTAPEAAWAITRAQKLSDGEPPDPPDLDPSDRVLTQDAGQTTRQPSRSELLQAHPAEAAAGDPTARTSPDRFTAVGSVTGPSHPVVAREAAQTMTVLEQLKATARGAVDEENWVLLRALEPLIAAESKRASAAAPVSLEVVRVRREGKS